MELVVSGNKDTIVMVEGEADLISEDVFVEALKFAHEDIKKIIALQEEIAKEALYKASAKLPIKCKVIKRI